MKFFRSVRAPGGLIHVQDLRRGHRTLCGRGVFFRDGWRISVLARMEDASCQVCARIARRKTR